MGNVMSMNMQSDDREPVSGGIALKERVRTDAVPKRRGYEIAKRVFDIIGSGLGLIILIPVFLIIGIMIMAERSGKHVFYKQRRVGRYGKEIYIYKFRTMVDGAENLEKWFNEDQLRRYYAEYKIEDDPRVTKIGKLLRRTGLDELPQILNIFKGELSIVGPRPIQESELAFYGDKRDVLLSARPGLTGYWQVFCTKGAGASYLDGRRQKMELMYISKRGFWFDIKICFATFGALVRKAKRGQ